MARKQIIFVIVEGTSDDEALGLLLNKLFDKDVVYVHITHGDVTTESGTNATNISSKIASQIIRYARSNHLSKQHFKEIIHIVDMDGAYIPDCRVFNDNSATKPIYSLTGIRTKNVQGICSRNMQKRQCLDRISTMRSAWGVPYQVYYMSCNLDHVLYNKQNASDKEKEQNAVAFARQYKENITGFVEYISESPFSVTDDYLSSWNYIKQECHSLERHTNLGICFKDNNAVSEASK